jgi:hypothetical protein
MTFTENLPATTAGSCSLRARPLRLDVQDAQPSKLWIGKRPGRDQVAGFMEVGEVGHVSVLKAGRRLLIEVGRVCAEDQESDGEMIQFHAHVSPSV